MVNLFLLSYNLLFVFILPVLFLVLIFKGFKNKEYLKRWTERVGLMKRFNDERRIWIHALSLGEVNASIPLVRQLIKTFDGYKILITTTTPSGSAQVKKVFGDIVDHVYLPYDFKFFIDSFLGKTKPSFGVIIETEIWPNLIYCSYKKSIPLYLVNARLSERSMKRYMFLRSIVPWFLDKFDMIAVRDNLDMARFKKLGVSEDKLKVIGNIKFDLNIDDDIYVKSQQLKGLFEGKIVFTAGSTHEGEEEVILNAYSRLVDEFKDLVLVIAPRDPKRGNDILKHAGKYSFKTVLKTDLNLNEKFSFNVLILNTLGELLLFYAISDVAFVGGSLVPRGGHNPLEPLSLRVPTIAGHYTYNFSELYEVLSKEKIIFLVNGDFDLYTIVKNLLVDNELRNKVIEMGGNFIQKNKGSTLRFINILKEKNLRTVHIK